MVEKFGRAGRNLFVFNFDQYCGRGCGNCERAYDKQENINKHRENISAKRIRWKLVVCNLLIFIATWRRCSVRLSFRISSNFYQLTHTVQAFAVTAHSVDFKGARTCGSLDAATCSLYQYLHLRFCQPKNVTHYTDYPRTEFNPFYYVFFTGKRWFFFVPFWEKMGETVVKSDHVQNN